jgi:HAD superfamily hydrolase (TIGR01549 family)
VKDAKYIYCDIGDTLIAHFSSEKVRRILGEDFDAYNAFRQPYDHDLFTGKILLTELLTDFFHSIQKDRDVSSIESQWQEIVMSLDIIVPMTQLVEELARRYPVGILSNMYRGHSALVLPKLPLVFREVLFSGEIGYMKPEPEIYAIATEKAGIPPEHIYLIDNEPLFVQQARAFGWQGIVFRPDDVSTSIADIRHALFSDAA